MQVDYFKDILVPVIGGLGIFMLGLEFMSDGIQNLAVSRMRALLARIAGTPIKGVVAGTLITGVIQSSTAMTVMVVGLVNSGVLALRPAISVIMGANIGTTLGNGLIALPLGPLGLLLAGVFALVHVFAKNDRLKNIALACMGFALIFYGLNLMTGGLRPLRNIPEVMAVISNLRADSLVGLISCVLIAALITAMIHSSSATIGIVMGLGAAGVLGWQTAVAFSLGADLGTTITSWIASLNLSKNAKRAAYAHISFNIIGVLVMLPLFFPAMQLLSWAMGFFGGDPGVAVMRDGKETFPLVPVAVGLYSTSFNIFNTLLLFPFVSVFERVLSRIGHTVGRGRRGLLDVAVPRSQQERSAGDRGAAGAAGDGPLPRGRQPVPGDRPQGEAGSQQRQRSSGGHRHPQPGHPPVHGGDVQAGHAARRGRSAGQPDRGAGLHLQPGRDAVSGGPAGGAPGVLARWPGAGRRHTRRRSPRRCARGAVAGEAGAAPASQEERQQFLLSTREQCLQLGADLTWEQRGAILELLGSAERAFFLIDRIDAERRSVPRAVPRPRRRRRSPWWPPARTSAPAST